MFLLKKILLILFDIIDKYIHRENIKKFIINNNIKIDNYIDVGSHLGTYTDLILSIYPSCSVILIEPQKKIFKKIKAKYKKNNKIKFFNVALSNKESKKKLKINKHGITTTLSMFNEKNNYLKLKAKLFGSTLGQMTEKIVYVKTKKLDNIISKQKSKTIDLIKIDTEGHEYEVLKGAKKKIKKIKYLLVEFHQDKIFKNYSSNKIHSFLKKNNFLLIKIIKFPFARWHDRFYINRSLVS